MLEKLLLKIKLNQRGVGHPLLLVAALGVIGFILVSSSADFKNQIFSTLFPKQASKAAPTITNPAKLSWNGSNWNVTGANVPWYNWACDFGCNTNGGVSGNQANLSAGFQQMRTAGAHVARWWVFPGDPWQIARDASGAPVAINPSVYADFDAALALANTYDLYYNFVLFSAATAPPRAWITDPTQRAQLVQALGTLFAHYANSPRILSWEIYNEPEFQIWNNQIPQADVVETARLIADSVHQNSNAYVTIGNAFADGIPMWNGVNLDYYSPHWYDYMSGGTYCLRCNDYAYYQSRFGITKPIVVGETYIGQATDALARLNDFYNRGYAGAWGWSLFPDRTSDHLDVDFTAMATFTSSHTDIGPRAGTVPPPPPPSPTPVPTSTPGPVSTPTPAPTPAIDTTPPSVVITSPVDGLVTTRNTRIDISANAIDNVGVTRVEFWVGNSLVNTDTTAPYSYRYKLPGRRNVAYTITARAVDAANNSSADSVTILAR